MWILTTHGIMTAIIVFAFFMFQGIILTHFYLPGISTSDFIFVFVMFWSIWTLVFPLIVFELHKRDYVCVGSNRIEYRNASQVYSWRKDEIRINSRRYSFDIYQYGKKIVRINKSAIFSFVNGEDLRNVLESLALLGAAQ